MSYFQSQENSIAILDDCPKGFEPAQKVLLRNLCEFVYRQARFGMLAGDASLSERIECLLDDLQDMVAEIGQCLVLDCEHCRDIPVAGHFLSALMAWRQEKPFRVNLPDILRHQPNTPPVFINRAILWQRLGDRLVEDDDSERPTLVILKNLDAADTQTQHDLARLIRFHGVHRVRRTFLGVLRHENVALLEHELLALIDQRFDLQEQPESGELSIA